MRDPGLLVDRLRGCISPILEFLDHSSYSRRKLEPGIADFVLGNPHDMPLPAIVEALSRSVRPQTPDWFAYKMSEPGSTRIVAETLRRRTGLPFDPDDICMTNGAFAGISVALRALLQADDEVIFLSPPWFFYEQLITAAGATPRRVQLEAPAFALDAERIRVAITPRTRAVIVNSPHNPTGRIYSVEELAALAEVLKQAAARLGHPIHLLSDEAYCRIVYDDRRFSSPAECYADTLIIYTYGKTLLIPGQRIGYIALPPTAENREELRRRLLVSQMATGWAFPNADLQHALAELEPLCIDVQRLQRRRDAMAAGLRAAGYDVVLPEGTFYMLCRSPLADDRAFCERLAARDCFVLPGAIVELPGWFRISLTATDAMVEQGLKVLCEVRSSL